MRLTANKCGVHHRIPLVLVGTDDSPNQVIEFALEKKAVDETMGSQMFHLQFPGDISCDLYDQKSIYTIMRKPPRPAA